MSTEEENTVHTFEIDIPDEELEAIDKAAEEAGVTREAYITQLIEEYLNRVKEYAEDDGA